VEARISHHHVDAAVLEWQGLDVRFGELDPVNATAVGLGTGAPEHQWREVGCDVVELLLGP
jgi:hypothetical protein